MKVPTETPHMLFLEIYSAFSQEEIPTEKQVKEILVSYVNDYCQDMVETRIREAIDPENNFIVKMILESDLNDLSYLYRSENSRVFELPYSERN